jgi:hypothetical protein
MTKKPGAAIFSDTRLMQLTYSYPSLLDSVTTEELKSYYVKRAFGLHEARIEKKPGVTPVCQASD